MKRVADYVVERLYKEGVEHIFFVPGSGCMFLTDALVREENVVGVNMNHEQSAGMAALAYAQINNKVGACLVTTGCGGTNAITALLHAWQDSIPCVFLSGQAETNHTIRNSNVKLRQFGRQEADIISIVSPISKYAVMINDPKDIVYEMEKAIFLATTGRKGPVWIDIPLDVQSGIIDENACSRFEGEDNIAKADTDDIKYVLQCLTKSERPIILAGNGIKLSHAESYLKDLIYKHDIPLVYSRLGTDLVPTDDKHSIGMVGMLGASRSGNFAIQNSDCVICIGCRLSINTTGYEYEKFVREGKLIVVDIDEEEHEKNTVRIDKFIKSDAKLFLEKLLAADLSIKYEEWLEKCIHWKESLPILLDDYKNREKIDMYDLAEQISDILPDGAVIVSDAGDGYYVGTSGFHYKENQIAITSGAQAEMGFAIPGAIGAAFATESPILVFVGDGSFMMNLQELATVAHYNIAMKIILVNNNGYSCIRKLHQGTFKRYIGCDPSQGLGLPEFEAVSKAFGIEYRRIEQSKNIKTEIKKVLEFDGPVICEVMCTEEQQFLFVTTKRNKEKRFVNVSLENQSPFLDEEIFTKEMVVVPVD